MDRCISESCFCFLSNITGNEEIESRGTFVISRDCSHGCSDPRWIRAWCLLRMCLCLAIPRAVPTSSRLPRHWLPSLSSDMDGQVAQAKTRVFLQVLLRRWKQLVPSRWKVCRISQTWHGSPKAMKKRTPQTSRKSMRSSLPCSLVVFQNPLEETCGKGKEEFLEAGGTLRAFLILGGHGDHFAKLKLARCIADFMQDVLKYSSWNALLWWQATCGHWLDAFPHNISHRSKQSLYAPSQLMPSP